MKKLKAFKFRLRATPDQEKLLRQYAGCARYCYNKALRLQIYRHEQGLKKLSYPELSKELTSWKRQEESAFLKQAPSHILQQKLMDLDKAYQNFFQKRTGFPKFRKRGIHDSFRFPDAAQIKLEERNNCVQLPKIGWIPYHNSQVITGTLKNATLSCESGRWYISFQTEEQIEEAVHPSTSLVGIDMGVVNFVTVSNGTVVPPIHALSKRMKKLKREQRKLSRKKKGSTNRRKQQMKVARVHQKIANTRKDFIHKITTQLSKSHAVIVLEDLKVSNMSRSAKGSLENPGKNVKAKSGLNRSILDQGWGEFRRQLTYKQGWKGGQVILVSPSYTSQTCSCCGHVSADNHKSQSVFECITCGHNENADINASKNILAAGHAVIACGETIRPKKLCVSKAVSVKQEPPKNQAAA